MFRQLSTPSPICFFAPFFLSIHDTQLKSEATSHDTLQYHTHRQCHKPAHELSAFHPSKQLKYPHQPHHFSFSTHHSKISPTMTEAALTQETRRIPISSKHSDPPEWSMLELNGTLIPPVELPTREAATDILGADGRVELGRLQIGPDGKVGCKTLKQNSLSAIAHIPQTPLMILGSHQLKGKVETLKQPFALLEKCYDENDELCRFEVKGVVRQKILFDQYPKVIMR